MPSSVRCSSKEQQQDSAPIDELSLVELHQTAEYAAQQSITIRNTAQTTSIPHLTNHLGCFFLLLYYYIVFREKHPLTVVFLSP